MEATQAEIFDGIKNENGFCNFLLSAILSDSLVLENLVVLCNLQMAESIRLRRIFFFNFNWGVMGSISLLLHVEVAIIRLGNVHLLYQDI